MLKTIKSTHSQTKPQTKSLGRLARSVSDHVSKVGGTTIEISHLDQENYTACIRVLQLNADGLRSKSAELELVLQNYEFHIVCVHKPNFVETTNVPLKSNGNP